MTFVQQSCEDFVERLASREPVPGGGGAAAYVAAVGMALGSMVGNLTLGKKKYVDVQQEIQELLDKAGALQRDLLALVEKDAEVFEPLSRAYGMPRETLEQQAEKDRVMEQALRTASGVPLEIMEKCCEAIDLHRQFAQKGTAIAISDVGCGVACCRAALLSASLNVYINTKGMRDRDTAQQINDKTQRMLDHYTAEADEIYEGVLSRLR